jgi:hypothetical protein
MRKPLQFTDGVWFQAGPVNLGFLPDILLPADKRPVKEQLEDRYSHGGGWRPIHGFRMDGRYRLHFPGDPVFEPAACIALGDELVIFYPNCSLLAVLRRDKSFEVTRVD